jgi:8-oxo-dGTP pyrophosphatase MutT (NUDIX family)
MLLDDDLLRRGLAPLMRTWDATQGLRTAAVLAPIFRRGGEDWLLFTERRADLLRHPGQISFPGGASEADEDPVSCALRETEEEIGQARQAVTLIGALATRTSTSSFCVHTLVGRIPAPIDLHPDPTEVTSLLEVRLRDLIDASRWQDRDAVVGPKRYRASPHFEHEEHTIWGLTGRLTTDLMAVIRDTHRG